MEDLTFGEQVKIILGRKGMTIKQLAELIEEKTGKKMSRQNLTQRLGRDNFQEQDMRMIAEMLDCPFHLSIMSVEGVTEKRSTAVLEQAAIERVESVDQTEKIEEVSTETPVVEEEIFEEQVAEPVVEEPVMEPVVEELVEEEPVVETVLEVPVTEESSEHDMTIGELYEIHEELSELEENARAGEPIESIKRELEKPKKEHRLGAGIFKRKVTHEEAYEEPKAEPLVEEKIEPVVESSASVTTEKEFEPVVSHSEPKEEVVGDVNPYSGKEYQSNSVRMHPTRIGYVQVYDRSIHKWTDMTEWAFLGLQERKKALLGKAYEPPIYLD